ncbi:MAG: hypothetical protein EHM59_22420 [Betaproteobacteria bacterium]|nr:MAG: hypothetical protein EHM59_22420 [Betaproteobacteria bacterium]
MAHLPGVRIQNAIYSLPGVQWLGENSYLYSLAFNGAWRYAQSLMAARASAAPVEYAVALKTGPSPRELSLATALVERMRRFCASRGMRFIVVDIPVPRGRYDWVPSAPEQGFSEAELLTSAMLFGAYEGAAALHLPRGHRHLSELGHALVAAELGRRIAGR